MSTADEVSSEEWAKRVRQLSAAERAQRAEAVSVLLAEPEDISDPLETELYILRDQLAA